MKCRVGLAQSTAREVECAEVSESQLPQPPPEPLGMTHELLATCSKHNSHNIASELTSEPAGDQEPQGINSSNDRSLGYRLQERPPSMECSRAVIISVEGYHVVEGGGSRFCGGEERAEVTDHVIKK